VAQIRWVVGMSKEPNKAVVRLLPPEITEEELYGSIGEEHLKHALWRSFLPGKRYKGEKLTRNTRCYLNFDTVEALEGFIKDYHGHQFVDDKGEPFRAVACYAPCPKIPKQKVQKDTREGTVEDDPIYKAFVEALKKPKGLPEPKEGTEPVKKADVGDTPLLAFMKKQAKDKKARAERQKKKWDSYEDEGSKRSKWYCSECYTTNTKKLEEDPDNRGTFYCKKCWESWETAPKGRKKNKKEKDYEYEDYQESGSRRPKQKRSGDTKGEWRVKDTTQTAADEEGDARNRRKKKKDKYEEAEETKGGARRKWQPKWEATEEEHDKRNRKTSSKVDKDDWWRESESTAHRWKAKDEWGEEAGDKEQKPRRGRREWHSKKAEDEQEDSSSYWKPRGRHAK